MSYNCKIILKGHILDSLILSKIMDNVFDCGAKCYVLDIKIGEEKTAISNALLNIEAQTPELLNLALMRAEKHGATRQK